MKHALARIEASCKLTSIQSNTSSSSTAINIESGRATAGDDAQDRCQVRRCRDPLTNDFSRFSQKTEVAGPESLFAPSRFRVPRCRLVSLLGDDLVVEKRLVLGRALRNPAAI